MKHVCILGLLWAARIIHRPGHPNVYVLFQNTDLVQLALLASRAFGRGMFSFYLYQLRLGCGRETTPQRGDSGCKTTRLFPSLPLFRLVLVSSDRSQLWEF